ncbi:MAG: hypothetical protein ABII82_14695 [Verrucomicrobiota bacterium]
MRTLIRFFVTGSCLALIPCLPASTLQLNFGAAASLTGWNDITTAIGSSPTGTLANLVDSTGAATDVSFAMNARFNGTNTNGPTTGNHSFGIPDAVIASSLYGNSVTFNNAIAENPTFTLSGLDQDLAYTFVVYASRMSVGDDRSGTYTATGLNTVSGVLNASGNTSLTLTLLNVRPDASGNIVFDITQTEGVNNNTYRFTYLNALTLSGSSVIPEPSAAAALTGGVTLLLAGVHRHRRMRN